MKPGALQLFPPPNRRNVQGNADEVEAEFDKCDAVVDVEYRTRIMHHACLETHGVVCDYRGGNSATVYASTQGTFTIPGDAARCSG
ncbi:MAG: molybdopterin-dependent oxidoreductase [Rubrivivax sp.]